MGLLCPMAWVQYCCGFTVAVAVFGVFCFLKPTRPLPMPLDLLQGAFWGAYYVWQSIAVCVVAVVASPMLLLGYRRAHYRLCCHLADFNWRVMAWSVDTPMGLKLMLSGDTLPEHESALVLLNHQSYVDFLVMFLVSVRVGMLGTCRFFVKEFIRYIPGFGWGAWLQGSIFVQRDWLRDQKTIRAAFQRMRLMAFPVWVISFTEGTRLTKKKLAEGQEFSRKKGLPVMKYSMLPRVKGVAATLQGLEGHLSAVYIFTIGYSWCKPPTMLALLSGRAAGRVHVHIRRVPITEVPPASDEPKLTEWLYEQWRQKDELLAHLAQHDCFPNETGPLSYLHLPMKLD
eukprot:RCo023058